MPPPSFPAATIRTQVLVPLRFDDGLTTTARVFTFDGLADGLEHLAFGLGDRAAAVTSGESRAVPLVRPHSECLTGDVFGSRRCDCGAQLREAVERIAESGGYLLVSEAGGRGIGLYAKLEAYALQDTGLDTYEANLALGHREDERSYLVAAQMLRRWGSRTIALLSNNPDKAAQLRRYGVNVATPGADRRAPLGRQRPLPGHQGGAGRAHARAPAVGVGDPAAAIAEVDQQVGVVDRDLQLPAEASARRRRS